jgi:hypothetical protein
LASFGSSRRRLQRRDGCEGGGEMSNDKNKRRILSHITINAIKVTVEFESKRDKLMFERWVEKDYPDLIKRRLMTREVLALLADRLESLGG